MALIAKTYRLSFLWFIIHYHLYSLSSMLSGCKTLKMKLFENPEELQLQQTTKKILLLTVLLLFAQ
jgi:hypothetical protein